LTKATKLRARDSKFSERKEPELPGIEPEPIQNEMSKIKIMLVDDSQEILELLTEVLHGKGFEVYPYTSAKKSLTVYISRSDPIDLVISDMQMPEMDGVAFLIEIQKPKLVIITGGATLDRDDDQAEHYGLIDGKLYKPFKSKGVFTRIESLFS
jgi:response regulator RpfG family c-di-GMP phosphodiesterase